MAYYAVLEGRQRGIFRTWEECKKHVHGYKGAKFKKCETKECAEAFMTYKSYKPSKDGTLITCSDLKEGEVIAFVDGSFKEGINCCGYGIIMIDKEGKETRLAGSEDHPMYVAVRNVGGELLGAAIAVSEAIKMGFKKVYLHFDYEGIEKWITTEWRTNTDLTELYRVKMKEMMEHIEVVFIKVPAHTGIHYNEIADSLAKSAVDQYDKGEANE